MSEPTKVDLSTSDTECRAEIYSTGILIRQEYDDVNSPSGITVQEVWLDRKEAARMTDAIVEEWG